MRNNSVPGIPSVAICQVTTEVPWPGCRHSDAADRHARPAHGRDGTDITAVQVAAGRDAGIDTPCR